MFLTTNKWRCFILYLHFPGFEQKKIYACNHGYLRCMYIGMDSVIYLMRCRGEFSLIFFLTNLINRHDQPSGVFQDRVRYAEYMRFVGNPSTTDLWRRSPDSKRSVTISVEVVSDHATPSPSFFVTVWTHVVLLNKKQGIGTLKRNCER